MFPVKCFVHMIRTGNVNGYLDSLDKKISGLLFKVSGHKECYNSQSIRE